MSVTEEPIIVTTAPLELLERRSRTTDDVYESLRAAILSKRLAPGERLSVPNLAARLGVSRSPVREAVQKLVQQGLATEEVHRGAIVAQFDSASLARLYELREVLEGLAARMACERATELEVAQLVEILAQHEDAVAHEDYRRHIELDRSFHAVVRRASRNEHLLDALERVQDKVAIAMLSADVSWPRHAVAEHRAILAAIQERSPLQAQSLACAHIARLRRDIVEAFDGTHTVSSVVDRVESGR